MFEDNGLVWDRLSVELYALSAENIFQPNRAWNGLERTLLGPYNILLPVL